MEPPVVAAIISASVAFLVFFATRIFEVFQNRKIKEFEFAESRKSQYASIITKQTLDNLFFIRKNVAAILSLTHPFLLGKPDKSVLSRNGAEIIAASVNIESQFKTIFQREVEIVNVIRELISAYFAFHTVQIDNPDDLKAMKVKIAELHKKCAEHIAPYDYADWLYCKEQVYNINTPIDYGNIYIEQLECFKQSEKPIDWIELMTPFIE